ncbi:MAG: prenyltransferase/squalene oxidase repeat-containing protein [Planctomycetota bacterium]
MIDPHVLHGAYQTARRELLARRTPDGHWVGELSGSALSTATAVSALCLYARGAHDESRRGACLQLVSRGVEWLTRHQNEDGGWGDTEKSFSNISTTILVVAAMRLAEVAQHYGHLVEKAEAYIASQGGMQGLRARYGDDKTFAVPILTNAALAGMFSWCDVPALPFELAALPNSAWKLLRLPVVSYAIPALVAIGQARFFHRAPRNPLAWLARRLTVGRGMRTLERMQPPSGGYIEAIPLTSFVVMSLASTGRVDHQVTRRGVSFLLSTIRPDGAWPIDSNLATWVSTQSIAALSAASGEVGALGGLDWLLDCQNRDVHPFTFAAPGGWGWSDLSGSVPDVDDTSGALVALAVLRKSSPETTHARIDAAALAGLEWLLSMQNADGGWPTFCRGWGRMPFDRSATDLTAHALRAIHRWRGSLPEPQTAVSIQRALDYLSREQRSDGAWVPLWFGNQYDPREENPVYGTARAIQAYRDLGLLQTDPPQQGLRWLAAAIGPDGGWGSAHDSNAAVGGRSSVEETALAVDALLTAAGDPQMQPAIEEGLRWLVTAVHSGRYHDPAPIGFYFAKLWYYERLYPLIFTVSALGRAVRTVLSGGANVEVARGE